ncbi:MAG: DUF1816 domain-containing protein [Microcystaceae cyanobacterium]
MQDLSPFIIYFLLFGSLLWAFRAFRAKSWWVRVDTRSPKCRYYFGPFNSSEEAEAHHKEYLQDLEAEGATGIEYVIKRGNPKRLTIESE